MNNTLLRRFTIVIILLLLISSSAVSNRGIAVEAAHSDVEGSASGIFANPAPASAVVNGVGTNSFTWGTGFVSPPSGLTFNGSTLAADIDDLFSFGTLSYFNGTILSGTGANSVDLQISIMLTMPYGITKEISQSLTLVNTLNVGTPEQ